jgi:hypothetical protein
VAVQGIAGQLAGTAPFTPTNFAGVSFVDDGGANAAADRRRRIVLHYEARRRHDDHVGARREHECRREQDRR